MTKDFKVLTWHLTSLDLDLIKQLWVCSGQTSLINGSPTLELVGLKGSPANALVPHTRAHLSEVLCLSGPEL